MRVADEMFEGNIVNNTLVIRDYLFRNFRSVR